MPNLPDVSTDVLRQILLHTITSGISQTIKVPQLRWHLINAITFSDLPRIIEETDPGKEGVYEFIGEAISRCFERLVRYRKDRVPKLFLDVYTALSLSPKWSGAVEYLWDLVEFAGMVDNPPENGPDRKSTSSLGPISSRSAFPLRPNVPLRMSIDCVTPQ